MSRKLLLLLGLLLGLVAITMASTVADEVAVADQDELDVEDQDELEVEDEDSTEDAEEAEDEAEDEAEEEADEDLESEAESAAEFEAAIGENAEGKWHVYSDTITQKAHEGIATAGLNGLASQADKDVYNLAKLHHGVIWNDMPSGVETEEAKMIKDGHMDVDTWSRIFFTTGGVDDLVFNVHYGCLQHLHSMAPIQRLQAKANPSQRLVFTNSQVRNFIKQQLISWWTSAVNNKANKDARSWYIGHILHAIQDSFPRGHVVRASTANACGDIILFQGYDAQHGNGAHKKADYSPASKSKEADATLSKRYSCAVDYSKQILQAYANCVNKNQCGWDTTMESIFNAIYKMAAGADARIAGGSAAEFAKAGAEADTTNFKVEMANGVKLVNLKSTNVWGTAASRGKTLCGGTRPIQSKAPTGWGVYSEKNFNGYVDQRG